MLFNKIREIREKIKVKGLNEQFVSVPAFPQLIQLKPNDLRYLKIYHINWPVLRHIINMAA